MIALILKFDLLIRIEANHKHIKAQTKSLKLTKKESEYMDVVRTTTLAIGASLIGSSLFMVIEKPHTLSLIILALGALFLLHGTGFLQEYMVRRVIRRYRTIRPSIGIISDLPWPRNGSYDGAWSKMKPEEWHSKIKEKLKANRLKAKVKLINITNPWTSFFIDRQLVIINPYGSIYPETNIENLAVMQLILRFINNGGIFLNVADVPFFFPYNLEKNIMYCPTRHGPSHFYKYQIKHLRELISNKQNHKEPYPGLDTPFSEAVMADIMNTEIKNNKRIIPMHAALKLKDSNIRFENVVIHRGLRCNKNHIKSIVDELEWDGMNFTPLCYAHYGKGKSILSLFFLESDEQQEETREKITNLQCDLIIKEVMG